MFSNQHVHELSDDQLICDNEECRKRVLDKIKDIKNDFDEIVNEQISNKNKIDREQAWKIINLTTERISNKLILLLNKEEIGKIIQKFMRQNRTKQSFDKSFEDEKNRNSKKFISSKQLWDIYINMCNDTIHIISKTSKER